MFSEEKKKHNDIIGVFSWLILNALHRAVHILLELHQYKWVQFTLQRAVQRSDQPVQVNSTADNIHLKGL